MLVQGRVHRARFPHLGDGPHTRTQPHLREENQNRQTWLCDLRRRMAIGRRTFIQSQNNAKVRVQGVNGKSSGRYPSIVGCRLTRKDREKMFAMTGEYSYAEPSKRVVLYTLLHFRAPMLWPDASCSGVCRYEERRFSGRQRGPETRGPGVLARGTND